jgi:HYR domain-containing protein
LRKVIIAIGVLLAAVVPMSAVATPTSTGLLITDDVTSRVYKMDATGVLDPSVGFQITGQFGITRGTSDISVDPTDDTLWLAGETSRSNGVPGGVINWTTGGTPLSGISETTYGGDGTEGVAADVWASDGTLWVIDDPLPELDDDDEIRARLRHLDRSGAVLGSWTAIKALSSEPSQQAIAVDPTDGSLWITDNAANRIFNIARPSVSDSALTELARINPIDPGNFGDGTPGVDRVFGSLQGIGVDADGTLWVTARKSSNFLHGKIYHVTRTGLPITSFLSVDVYGGENPTGIAYTCPTCSPDVAVSPSPVEFGVVATGGSAAATVAIANTGSSVLSVTGLGLNGSGDFALGAAAPATPFSVAVGDSVEVPVVYTPVGGNDDTGALSVNSNDPDQGVVTADLHGSEPPLDTTPPLITFGAHPASYTVDQTVAITCTASDDSGIASTTCQSINAPAHTFVLGSNTISASATDNAGNSATATTSFTVRVTPTSLCLLTKQFVQGSAKYQALKPSQRAFINALVTAVCQKLDSIVPRLTASQKAALIAAYKSGVQALAQSGWLTAAQATKLSNFANAL